MRSCDNIYLFINFINVKIFEKVHKIFQLEELFVVDRGLDFSKTKKLERELTA